MRDSVRVALVQQRASADLLDNRRRGLEAFRKAAQAGADLVAFAELAFSPFWPQHPARPRTLSAAETIPGPTTEAFSSLAAEHGVVAVLNLFERRDGRTFDSSPVIDSDGSLLGVTRMVHIMEGPGFHEKGYYAPGEAEATVFDTGAGKVGVAICYDRHFPEYMRHLALRGAEIVVVPQAGAVDEWPEGIFEGEMKVAAFQNGFFTVLVNRVGREERLEFAGESFVADPWGRVIGRAPRGEDFILTVECDLGLIASSPARKHFLPDRRPEVYGRLLGIAGSE